LAKECIDLCSKKKPSLLRSSGPEEMLNFSLSKLCKEWKERAPLFYSFLMTCATGKDKKIDWFPSVAVAGSALLKERNMHMNATQALISVMLRQSGIQVNFFSICYLFISWDAYSYRKITLDGSH